MLMVLRDEERFYIQCPYCKGAILVKRVNGLLLDVTACECCHSRVRPGRESVGAPSVISFTRPLWWGVSKKKRHPIYKQESLSL